MAALSAEMRTREQFLLTVADDTEDAPWMVMNSLQVRDIDLLKSILQLHARRQDLPWMIDSYLKVSIPRPDGRPLDAAPDLMVALGVEDRLRTSWQIPDEGKAPEFALEVSSPDSWARDRDEKPSIYDCMGVSEYVLFFPRQQERGPWLLGHRRGPDGAFVEIAPDARGLLWCTSLDLGLTVEGGLWLRAVDAQGRRLPSPDEWAAAEAHARRAADRRASEEVQARAQAEQRASEEAKARIAAEDEVHRLREALRRRDQPAQN